MLLSLHILLAGCALAAAAVPAPGFCAKPPYKLVLALSTYPPAQSFCQARFPVVPSTVTTTVTTTLGAAGLAARQPVPVTPGPAARLEKNAVECKGNCAAWSSLSKIGGSLVSSACNCIQTKPTVTTTVGHGPFPRHDRQLTLLPGDSYLDTPTFEAVSSLHPSPRMHLGHHESPGE